MAIQLTDKTTVSGGRRARAKGATSVSAPGDNRSPDRTRILRSCTKTPLDGSRLCKRSTVNNAVTCAQWQYANGPGRVIVDDDLLAIAVDGQCQLGGE